MNDPRIQPSHPKEIAIIGAGGRGRLFARLIREMPHLARVTAVAEPREENRAPIIQNDKVPPARVFNTWEEFVQHPKMCDAVIIATMDRMHVGPTVACLKKGYDVLLEKPIGVTLEECRQIEAAQRQTGKIVCVAHSLRYHKGFRKVKELLDAGVIGRIITLDLIEQVAWWHQAHSFVRGNFGNESRASFMLLAKSCHDIDYIYYLLQRPCLSVSSYGALTYFKRENAPAASTERCTDPCPVEPVCHYSAIKQYVQIDRTSWPASACSQDHSQEAHMEAIRTGPYGRCVWKCDNDVVDHQVVAMQFADEITATFTMTAFTLHGGRRMRVHGTLGELFFSEDEIQINTFADKNVQKIAIFPEKGGHGGGDMRLTRDWLAALHAQDDSLVVANAQESLRSHTIAFAAEKARRENRVVKLSEMCEC